jgi:hypothetical protein
MALPKFLFFFIRQLQQPRLHTREKERQTPLRTRKKEKKRARKRKKKNYEICLVSLFSAVGSPPPILAMLVGSQQHKLPSISSLR